MLLTEQKSIDFYVAVPPLRRGAWTLLRRDLEPVNVYLGPRQQMQLAR